MGAVELRLHGQPLRSRDAIVVTQLFRRSLTAFASVLGISIVAFALMRVTPGDPADFFVDPQLANRPGGAEYVAQQRARLHLDDPVPVQFIAWLQAVAPAT